MEDEKHLCLLGYEEMVPFVISEPLNADAATVAAGDPRNFDVFAVAWSG